MMVNKNDAIYYTSPQLASLSSLMPNTSPCLTFISPYPILKIQAVAAAKYIGKEDFAMQISELDRILSQIAEDFATETKMLSPEGNSEPVTSGDLSELSRQVFYALNEYKKAIVKALNDK